MDGEEWIAWEVLPSRQGHLPEAAAAGWLAFECSTEKRRLTPIPREWETWSEERLRLALENAFVVRKAPTKSPAAALDEQPARRRPSEAPREATAPDALGVRSFTARGGEVWNVWAVVPEGASGRSPLLPENLLGGWLCFASGERRVRRWPIPEGWEGCSGAELDALLHATEGAE